MAESRADLRFIVPPAQDAGAYADVLAPWFTAHEFTLDINGIMTQYEDRFGPIKRIGEDDE